MHKTRAAAVLFFGFLTGIPAVANAQKSSPPARAGGFGMFLESSRSFEVNRVSCDLRSVGWICENSGHGAVTAWPKGTNNSYIFNSGPQVAGIVGAGGAAWAGDTTGGMFFDARGFLSGVPLTEIYSTEDPEDRDDWPEAALVPSGGTFPASLEGRISASDGDFWWMAWEGDPQVDNGRPHPLGIVAEFRILGWNYPLGNEDILYAIITYYNITSLDPAAYAGARAGLRDSLLSFATRFHNLNNEAFGITIPASGYTIEEFHAVYQADPDVANAFGNYASVNLPLSMGYAWEEDFSAFAGWRFDPGINSDPFLPASGLVGLRMLGRAVRLFTVTTNDGATLADPMNTTQLFRRASGQPESGCSYNPAATGICFITSGQPYDIRTFQSIGPFTLAPGESVVQSVAIVHAAPLPGGGCPGAGCSVNPGNPSIIAGMDDPGIVAAGVNPIDSIAGFAGAQDFSGDGILQGDEFLTVPRSLLWKAQVAEALSDHQFVLPEAPEAPEFFLIPEESSVTVVWRPSMSEQTGDPYFDIARSAMIANDKGVMVPNVLYDPNYRQFDVEGYRIYRGRTDDPATMELVAQFDYDGTVISDYGGYVNPTQFCAPELSVTADCEVMYDPVLPGIARVSHVDHPLVGLVPQARPGDRIALSTGLVQILRSDTVDLYLTDTGVPFAFRDSTVHRGFRYFYSVVAFDVNSLQSSPASLESPRMLKETRQEGRAGNFLGDGRVSSVRLIGRGVVLDSAAGPWGTDGPLPVLDSATGRFSGPFPPANGWNAAFGGFVSALLDSGRVTLTLDSVVLGSPYADLAHHYWWTSRSGGESIRFSVPILQAQLTGISSARQTIHAVPADPGLAARYGGSALSLALTIGQYLPGTNYAGLFGRGCANQFIGFESECAYNGSRWFDGPSPANNEAMIDPIAGNQSNNSGIPVTDYNNAGELSGVVTIHNTQAYQSVGGVEYRAVEGVTAGAHRAADFNVYWGSGGRVDSVIDITHHVPVPFSQDMGSTWGILTAAAAQPAGGSYDQRPELTSTDMGCVEPLRSFGTDISCGVAGPRYRLIQSAQPGPISYFSPALSNSRTSAVAVNAGIVFYLAGDFFTMELAGGRPPVSGTVWSLRQYVGAISGGNGAAGDFRPYEYSNPEGILPLTAVGTEIVISWTGLNAVRAPTREDLSKVHPVPDPYMFGNSFTNNQDQPVIRFVNLPEYAVIRIYTASGILVRLIEHHSGTFGGAEDWDVRTRDGRRVASGVYFYHLEAGDARRVGRMTIVNPSGGR